MVYCNKKNLLQSNSISLPAFVDGLRGPDGVFLVLDSWGEVSSSWQGRFRPSWPRVS